MIRIQMALLGAGLVVAVAGAPTTPPPTSIASRGELSAYRNAPAISRAGVRASKRGPVIVAPAVAKAASVAQVPTPAPALDTTTTTAASPSAVANVATAASPPAPTTTTATTTPAPTPAPAALPAGVDTSGPFPWVPGIGVPVGVQKDQAGTITSTWFRTPGGILYSEPGAPISASARLPSGEWEYPVANTSPGYVDGPNPGDLISPNFVGGSKAYDNTLHAWFPSSRQSPAYDQLKGYYQAGGDTPTQQAEAAAAPYATGTWAPAPSFDPVSGVDPYVAAGVSPDQNISVDATSPALSGGMLQHLGYTLSTDSSGQQVWVAPFGNKAGYTPMAAAK